MWKEQAEVWGKAMRRGVAAHWKKFFAAALCAGLIVGAAAGMRYFVFEVKGTVSRVDGSRVAVSDFLTTRVVDFNDSPIDPARVLPGDEVKIHRNLKGTVFSMKVKRRACDWPEYDDRY